MQRYSRRESALGNVARLLTRNESVAVKSPQAKLCGKARAGRGRGALWPRARVPAAEPPRATPSAGSIHRVRWHLWRRRQLVQLDLQAVRCCGVDVADADKRGSERAPPRERAAKGAHAGVDGDAGGEGRRHGSAQNPCGKIPEEERSRGITCSDILAEKKRGGVLAVISLRIIPQTQAYATRRPSSGAPCSYGRRRCARRRHHGAGGAPGALAGGCGVKRG
ncbi:hypothetical protein FB451DRAFT_1462320 [Mycena latifolia]|nr:hypothetical protein FB451DRAFT_1462320 [Mycena latifolia]